MEQIRVIIADDDDFVRDGMSIILDMDEDFKVIGCAKNGRQAVELARKETADVVLMDIEMPLMNGIEATKIIVEEGLGRVLILTTFDDYALVKEALQGGAKGYLIKNHPPGRLKQMIQTVHAGISVMDEKVIEAFTEENTALLACGLQEDKYTKRELEIIKLVSEGYSNKEIAKNLFITEGTVKNYISTILEKENLAHRTALAIYYLTGRKV